MLVEYHPSGTRLRSRDSLVAREQREVDMTETWIAVAAGAALTAGLSSRLLIGSRRTRPMANIVNLENETSVDPDSGAVRSVQTADLLLDQAALEEIWTPEHLERLARTSWRFLTRATLGLIRVRYTATERTVVLLLPPLRLLTFQAPEYEMDDTHGLVRWRIARGLLVSRRGRGRGYLQIAVRRSVDEGSGQARFHVEVAVTNFYPSIASRLSRPVYNATQSRIHVLVTYGFLRSLARLDLATSRIGRFAAQG
jgi:hypothetical protein